jgi:hypothetical protein
VPNLRELNRLNYLFVNWFYLESVAFVGQAGPNLLVILLLRVVKCRCFRRQVVLNQGLISFVVEKRRQVVFHLRRVHSIVQGPRRLQVISTLATLVWHVLQCSLLQRILK